MPQQYERHGRAHGFDSWEQLVARKQADDAVIAEQLHPDVVPQPEHLHHAQRKNTRDFCKGKEGVLHVPQLVWRPPIFGSFTKARTGMCGWMPVFQWKQGQVYVVAWGCRHEEHCASCKKVLRRRITDNECPHYPGTKEQHAAAEAEAKEFQARRDAEQKNPRRWRRRVITGPSHYRRKRT